MENITFSARAHCIERAAQRIVRAHAGGSDGNVSPNVEGGRLSKRAAAPIADQPAAVEAPYAERECLSAVTENESCLGVALEDTGEHQPQRVRRRLEGPAANRTPELAMVGISGRVIGRVARMEINGRIERGRTLPENGVLVEIEAFAVSLAVDKCTVKTEVAHAAFEFPSGFRRVLHGQ